MAQFLDPSTSAALYDQAACGLLTTDADGLITAINQTLLSWLGHPADRVTGRLHLVDLLTRGGSIFHETHYRPMLRLQGMVRELALELVCADGQRLPVLLNAATDVHDSGAPVQVAVMDARERRSYESELLRARVEAEESARRARAMARTLQEMLIPPRPPEIPRLDLAAAFRPAGGEVGGDFYDVFPLGQDKWAVVLGDVCGKGVGAAVISTLVRHTMRALMSPDRSPASVMAGLHQVLERDAADTFCTIVALRLTRRADRWMAEMASCGHPPVVKLSMTGEGRLLPNTGPLVGVLADPQFSQALIELEPGDSLVLYTDGITEARRDDEFFGEQRLQTTLEHAHRSPEHLVRDLVAAAVEFQSGELSDDIAVLSIGVPARRG